MTNRIQLEPEAQAFAEADSKGKAWQDIRQNPLIAKVVNGKRIAVKPSRPPLTGDVSLSSLLEP